MTEDRDFKQAVRRRAARTGESYQAAWRHLQGEDATVVLAGELSKEQVPGVRSQLIAALAASSSKVVVVDAAGVSGIGPDAVGVFVGALKRARAAGGDVVIRRPSRPVRVALSQVELLEQFGIGSRASDGQPGLVAPSLGRRLAAQRMARGLSIGAAAELVGVSRLKLDLIERGAAAIDAQLARRLVMVLELDGDVAASLSAAAGLALSLRGEELGDLRQLPEIAGAKGIWVSSALTPNPAWIDIFAVDGSLIVVPVVVFVDEDDDRRLATRGRVSISLPGRRQWSARFHRLSAAESVRGLELLRARYPAERGWLDFGPLLSIEVQP